MGDIATIIGFIVIIVVFVGAMYWFSRLLPPR